MLKPKPIQVRLKFSISESTPGFQLLFTELRGCESDLARRSRILQILHEYSNSRRITQSAGFEAPQTIQIAHGEPSILINSTQHPSQNLSFGALIKLGVADAGIEFDEAKP